MYNICRLVWIKKISMQSKQQMASREKWWTIYKNLLTIATWIDVVYSKA